MLVEGQTRSLAEAIRMVFRHPESFALPANAGSTLAADLVLEALMADWRWRWIVLEEIEYVVRQTEGLEWTDNGIVAAMIRGQASEPPRPPLSSSQLPTELHFVGPSLQDATVVRRAYGRREQCIAIAAAKAGKVGGYAIHVLSSQEAIRLGFAPEPLAYGLVGVRAEPQLLLRRSTAVFLHEDSTEVRDISYDLTLQEAFYLGDTGNLSVVGRLLYETRPQPAVEADLLTKLRDTDPEVRINVLTLLGMPAYKVGFIPGRELPPRDERLEPACLQPTTIEQILALGRVELDQGVLGNIVCTLKSQAYAGRLAPLRAEVRDSVRWELMPKILEPSTLKDCAVLLGELTP